MPEAKTVKRARKAQREGKAPTTAAGAFVHEEIEHIREGKHGARNAKQAIAIGLSKARRAGIRLPAPRKGTTSASTRKKAERDQQKGRATRRAASPRRSRATTRALKREGRQAASPRALSTQARKASRQRARRGNGAASSGPRGSRGTSRRSTRASRSSSAKRGSSSQR